MREIGTFPFGTVPNNCRAAGVYTGIRELFQIAPELVIPEEQYPSSLFSSSN